MTDVLVLFEYASLNGGEHSFLSVLPGLRRSGFRIHAAAPASGPLAKALADFEVPQYALTLHDSNGHRLSQDTCRGIIAKLLGKVDVDLVHANSLGMTRLVAPIAQSMDQICIGHLRDIMRISKQAVADLNAAGRLLAVSAATKEAYLGAGLDTDRTHVAHNGVDLQIFHPGPPTGYLHRELGLPKDARLIACIGQISLRKGFDIVLKAARKVSVDYPDVHWLVVGERHSQKVETVQFEQSLHEIRRSPELSGQVHFLGRRDDIAELLRELSLFVHAARQEPLGRVLLEAAATRLPIVATEVGGTRELFPADDQAAQVVAPVEPDPFAAAILRLLSDHNLARKLAQNARQRVEDKFSAEKATQRIAGHYEQSLLLGR